MKKLRCLLGIHYWGKAVREVHITQEPSEEDKTILCHTALLERCECGESRIVPFGREKPTVFVKTKRRKDSAKN